MWLFNQLKSSLKTTSFNRKLMKLTFLGTSSGCPTKDRNVSSMALSHENGEIFMFDCGEGTQHQLQKSTLRTGKISTIFITHLHGDHVFGLPGLICTMSGQNPEDRTHMNVFGPLGIRSFLISSLQLSDSHMGFKFNIYEMVPPNVKKDTLKEFVPTDYEDKGGYLFFDEKANHYFCHEFKELNFKVYAAPIVHKVFTVGYVLCEADTIGKLDMNKLKELGIKPGPILGKLKQKEDVKLEDGKELKWKDFIGDDIRGRKICILGDTNDPSGIAKLAENCDVITHESTLDDDDEKSCVDKGHSTPTMAAKFASTIKAKRLILTHYSARYAPEVKEKDDDRVSISILKDQALKTFSNVELAEDFKSFEIKKNK